MTSSENGDLLLTSVCALTIKTLNQKPNKRRRRWWMSSL